KFFFSSRRRHTRCLSDWSSDVCSSDLQADIAFLEIADDGLGFDVEAVNKSYDKRGSLGMVNLRERSELVNGILHIESAPGKGARSEERRVGKESRSRRCTIQ